MWFPLFLCALHLIRLQNRHFEDRFDVNSHELYFHTPRCVWCGRLLGAWSECRKYGTFNKHKTLIFDILNCVYGNHTTHHLAIPWPTPWMKMEKRHDGITMPMDLRIWKSNVRSNISHFCVLPACLETETEMYSAYLHVCRVLWFLWVSVYFGRLEENLPLVLVLINRTNENHSSLPSAYTHTHTHKLSINSSNRNYAFQCYC